MTRRLARALAVLVVGAGVCQAADGTPPVKLAPGTIPIVRTLTAAGTFYTVPTGTRLHVTALALSYQQSGALAAGLLTVVATPENDPGGTATLLALGIPATFASVEYADHAVLQGVDIPVAAGQAITLTDTAAGGTQSATLIGWQEPLTK